MEMTEMEKRIAAEDPEIAALFAEEEVGAPSAPVAPPQPAEPEELEFLDHALEGTRDLEQKDKEQQRKILDRSLDRLLERIGRIESAMHANEAVARDRIERAQLWLERENARHQRNLEFFTQVLQQTFAMYPLGPKERSRSLPCGTVGYRKVNGKKKIVDMDKAIDFALAHDLEIKQEVQISVINEWLKEVDEETGEVRELPDFYEAAEA
jgi:hypothetical protein